MKRGGPLKRSEMKRSGDSLGHKSAAVVALHTKVAESCCVVCRLFLGIDDTPAELHHLLDGQRRISHWHVIPLCPIHHRQGTAEHPSRHSVNGCHGGLALFEASYGTEIYLLKATQKWIGDEYSNNHDPEGLLTDEQAPQDETAAHGDDRCADTDADDQSDDGYARPQVEQLQAFNTPVHISVTHYRARLCDPDNLNAKGVIDAIVKAGLLQDDSASFVESIRHEQVKVKGYDQEKTRITIEEVI